jgi:hypothetical protein
MLANINNLREIARRCQTGEPLSNNLSLWLGESLNAFLNRQCNSIEDALGIRAPRGGIPWWREEAIRQRDDAIRKLAAAWFADLRPATQARQVHTLAIRYAASAWRYDRDRDDLPAHYLGKPQQWLWQAFRSGAPMPVCERQLRQILSQT